VRDILVKNALLITVPWHLIEWKNWTYNAECDFFIYLIILFLFMLA